MNRFFSPNIFFASLSQSNLYVSDYSHQWSVTFLCDILQQCRANLSLGPHRFDNVKASVSKGTYCYNNPNFITVQAICLTGAPFSHNQNVKVQHFLKGMHCFTGLPFVMERKVFYFMSNKYCLNTYNVLDSMVRMMT